MLREGNANLLYLLWPFIHPLKSTHQSNCFFSYEEARPADIQLNSVWVHSFKTIPHQSTPSQSHWRTCQAASNSVSWYFLPTPTASRERANYDQIDHGVLHRVYRGCATYWRRHPMIAWNQGSMKTNEEQLMHAWTEDGWIPGNILRLRAGLGVGS